MLRFLIVDDEEDLRFYLKTLLESRGYLVDEASDGYQAIEKVSLNKYDGIFLDVNMPRVNGIQALEAIKKIDPQIFCVLLTAYSNVDDAILAIKYGAYDYIEKPLTEVKLFNIIDEAMLTNSMVKEASYSSPQLFNLGINDSSTTSDSSDNSFNSYHMVGESDSIKKVFELIYKLIQVDTSVLIRGESGTGKELVARALHYSSYRKKHNFVVVNCGAIPENLIESELFGYEKGAFTGASKKKFGKFQFANGGTIFLDEIGDLPLNAQVKLLRVLQEKVITPIGSNQEIKVDVRIVAATHQPLEKLIKEKKFREDLFYRLNVLPIVLPPLRERIKDIKSLVYDMIDMLNNKNSHSFMSRNRSSYNSFGNNFSDFNELNNLHSLNNFNKNNEDNLSSEVSTKKILDIDYLALKALESYSWPGNIRELENVIERAFILENTSTITFKSLPDKIKDSLINKEKSENTVTYKDKKALDTESDINTSNTNTTASSKDESISDSSTGKENNLSSLNIDVNSEVLDFSMLKENFEKNFLLTVLKKFKGKINQISRNTNIPKVTLLRKLDKYHIDPKNYK